MLCTTAAICYTCLHKTNVFTIAPILAVFVIISVAVIALIYMDWCSSISMSVASLRRSLAAKMRPKFQKPGWYPGGNLENVEGLVDKSVELET